MFKTRLLSGIILVAVTILLIITGGWVLLAGVLFISLVGQFELYRVLGIHKSGAALIGYVITVAYDMIILFLERERAAVLLGVLSVAFLIALLFCYVITYPKYRADQIMGAFFGFFYVSVLLSYIYQTRMLLTFQEGGDAAVASGRYIVWLIFLCSWGSDTCAYCAGMLFGKHKMAPKLSPKKTWEGAAGGVIGAAALTAIYAAVFRQPMGLSEREILILSLISAAGAVISMVGDLAASAIKRNYEIKDYGKLIPGHGGILDRFDSVIITAPVIYYLAFYLL